MYYRNTAIARSRQDVALSWQSPFVSNRLSQKSGASFAIRRRERAVNLELSNSMDVELTGAVVSAGGMRRAQRKYSGYRG